MNAIVYNVALLLGLALIAFGVGASCGIPCACVVVGTLVIVLTLVGATLSTRRG